MARCDHFLMTVILSQRALLLPVLTVCRSWEIVSACQAFVGLINLVSAQALELGNLEERMVLRHQPIVAALSLGVGFILLCLASLSDVGLCDLDCLARLAP